jgi:hypothetical protein
MWNFAITQVICEWIRLVLQCRYVDNMNHVGGIPNSNTVKLELSFIIGEDVYMCTTPTLDCYNVKTNA